MNPQRKSGNEMIFAVSGDPNEKRKTPRKVPRKLVGTAAWKIHQMREVPDPNPEPVPQKIAPLPVAKPAPVVTTTADPLPDTPMTDPVSTPPVPPVAKRGPGRPKKDQTPA